MKFAVALLCVSLAAVKDAVQGKTRKHNTHANCCGSVGCKQDQGDSWDRGMGGAIKRPVIVDRQG